MMNDYYTKAFGIVLLICVTASCASRHSSEYSVPDFPVKGEARWEIISDELVYQPYTIDLSGEYLLVNGYEAGSPNTLFIYDKNSGKQVFSGLKRGRGSKETIFSRNNIIVHGGQVSQYDNVLGKKLSFCVDSIVKSGPSVIRDEPWSYPVWTTYMYEQGDYVLNIRNESPIARSKTDLPRIYLQDSDGMIVSEDDFSPIEDPGKRFKLYSFPCVSVSPDGRHIAVGITEGNLLETFSLGNGTFERIATGYYSEPDISCPPDLSGHTLSPDGLVGFNDIYALDDCVITSYDGVHTWSDSREKWHHNIAVFNWDCTPKAIYRTQRVICQLCAESDGHVIYGIVSDAEGRYFLAKTVVK